IAASLIGGLIVATDIGLNFAAFRMTTVTTASVIQSTTTIEITLGAARWFGERVRRSDFLLLGASLVGIALTSIGASDNSSCTLAGALPALASVFSWSAFWLYSKRARRNVQALEYVACSQMVAVVPLVLLAVVARSSLAPPPGTEWLAILALGVI